ncbi:MAG: hypothetical protein JO364_19600 [Pseudonocardiales bacterium]|nr:hypothetical protein [Pseudonocardiales bacterium]MBV9032463.1 hypothetical protein [Pseudonocardiales bacterium]
MYGDPGSAHRYAPDGLTGEALDELIDRAYAEVAQAPRPTSALLDGSAAEHRRRRTEHRALAAVIHALPVCHGVSSSDERRAA